MSNVIEFSIKAVDNFTATMGKVDGSLSTITNTFKAAAAAAGVYAAVRIAKTSLDNAEAMGVAAEKANMTVESYSALAWAAKMSNVEAGALSGGMKFLNKALSENAAPEAAAALSALGISTKDPTEALLQLSDKFYAAKDGANKTATAMAIFGRSGVDMVPLLNQGSGAIKQMMNDAQALGMVYSKDFAESAKQVNDNLETMSAVMSGTVNKVMQQLSPTLESLTGQMIGFALESGNTERIAQILATGMRVLVSVGLFVAETFNFAGKQLGKFFAAISIAAEGEFSSALGVMNSEVEFNMKNINAVWDGSAQSTAASEAKRITAMRKGADALATYQKEMADAKAEMIAQDIAHSDSMNKIVIDMQKEAATYGMTADQIKIYTLEIGKADAALIKEAKSIAASNAKLKAQEDALIDYKNTSSSVFGETNRQINEHIKSLGNITYQIASAITQTYKAAVKGIGDAVGESLVYGTSLKDGMEALAKQILAALISAFVQIGVQRVALTVLSTSAYATEAAAATASASVQVAAANTVATAWTAANAAMLGAAGVGAGSLFRFGSDLGGGGLMGEITGQLFGGGVGSTISKIGGKLGFEGGGFTGAGSRSGGMDGRGGFMAMLHPNETVIDHELGGSSSRIGGAGAGGAGGGLVIQNLTIHVLENATNTDAFRGMNKIELRNALGQPVVDALNEMFAIGVRPNFAMVNR